MILNLSQLKITQLRSKNKRTLVTILKTFLPGATCCFSTTVPHSAVQLQQKLKVFYVRLGMILAYNSNKDKKTN